MQTLLKLLLCALLFLQQVSSQFLANVTITVPEEIVVLTRGVTAVVHGLDNEGVLEVYHNNEERPLTGQIITQIDRDHKEKEAKLVFDCGYFTQIGNYSFKIRDGLTHKILNVRVPLVSALRVPEIELKLKNEHEASTTDVKVSVMSQSDICKSDVVSQYPTQLNLMRDNTVIMSTRTVVFPPSSTIFSCHDFTQPGNYKVQLRMTHRGDDVIVRESNVMQVHWSSEYSLKLPKKILSCSGKGIRIKVMRPPCVPSDDIIQAVAKYNNGSYRVLTNATLGTSDHVTIPCHHFSELDSPGVCFRYVTSQFITRTVCRQMKKDTRFDVEGNWSGWSYWNTCARPCTSPVHRRTRSCNSPRPRGRGAKCSKEPTSHIQYDIQRTGNKSDCPVDAVAEISNDPSSKCLCRCQVSNCSCLTPESPQKCILTSPISGEFKHSNEMIWKLYTSSEYVIRVDVIDIQTRFGEVITVRDGGEPVYLTNQNKKVISWSNTVTLRYVRSTHSPVTNSCGFILAYEAIHKSQVTTTSDPVSKHVPAPKTPPSLMSNPVLLGSVGACVLIIIIVAMVSILKCRKQRAQGKNFRKEEACLEQRLTTPPDGKSSSNIDTESERPTPLGESSRCDIELPVTPKPGVAYYLAQRQLQLMKKEGKENSSQTYSAICMNDDTIREQETLLFGNLSKKRETT
ncbi:unnamed protein product [Clavelina lepadiformis]|uniref:CUB domain-containing protein n=1 Tax=Clavelina lepadiformis TaxID=159417 RepID=A0ABP0H2L1_CLALP